MSIIQKSVRDFFRTKRCLLIFVDFFEAKWFLSKVHESFGSEMAFGRVLQRLACLSLIFAVAPYGKRF